MLCAIIGVSVVTLNFTVPEKIKEAFSGDGGDTYEDEDVSYGESYLNSAFFGGVTISPLASEATEVS